MRLRILAASAVLAPLLAACDSVTRSNVAFGSHTSIIVMATDQVWEAVGDSMRSALEPLVFTVTSERAFDVTHVRPGAPQWAQYKKFRQVMVIGTPADAWVEPALGKADTTLEALPALVETENVWALGQHVTVLALDPERPASAALALLEDVRLGVDRRFGTYVMRKMYVSGVNERLGEDLLREEGFSLMLPSVYREVPGEGVRIFKNDLPDPAELARYVLVQEVDGAVPERTAEALVDWRDSIGEAYPRAMVSARDELHLTELDGGVLEVQGRWETPPPDSTATGAFYPGGGPFIVRLVPCPDGERTYLVDSWLYAPGKDKLEYIMQLRAILGTFRCGGSGGEAAIVAS
ncbi:MAG TPA: DUF4837 family protein [Longimicrobiales bacterium]|nr:DUF4837 family protein [Longimicrobiales bacterium]